LYRFQESNKTFFPLVRCAICIGTRKKSQTYSSAHTLRYHITKAHEKQPENFDSIDVNEFRRVVNCLVKAQEWRIFIK